MSTKAERDAKAAELADRQAASNRCSAKLRRKGAYCKQPLGHGTDHPGVGCCKLHGGSTPGGVASARRKQALAAAELYGLPRKVDPHEALIEELHRTAGTVSWLTMMIQELDKADDLHGPVGGGEWSHPRTEAHIWIRLQQEERAHYLRVAKTCVEVGIAEREVQLAERQGELIAGVLVGVLRAFDIDPRSERARKIIRQELSAVTTEVLPA